MQAEIETDRYTSYLVGDAKARTTADVFPTLIEKHAYVFLGYATVTIDRVSVSIDGNTVTSSLPDWSLGQHQGPRLRQRRRQDLPKTTPL